MEKVQGGKISDFWPGPVSSLLTKSTSLRECQAKLQVWHPKD